MVPEITKPGPSSRMTDFVPHWFPNFIDGKSLEDIYDVIAAANYLDVPSLIELGCAKVGSLMREKSISELSKMLNKVNDYTPEEESAIIECRADIWGQDEATMGGEDRPRQSSADNH